MEREPISVLLVEDNATYAGLIQEYLREADDALVDVTRTDRLSAAFRRLAERAFDVILLDLNLPDSDGLDTFTRLRAAAPRTPVVILSGLDDRAVAAKTVRAGAQDFLVKDEISPTLLGRALRYAIERHRAEQILAERERLLELVFDTEPECVKLLRPDGTIMTMNRAGLAMIEAQALEQAVGRPALDLVAPEHQEAFRQLTARVFAGGSGTLEFEAIGFHGTRRWLETHAVPLRDADGAVFALLSITRDITERRRLQTELLQAQKMEVVGQLTGGIAHDFNNLLTVIDGRAQLLMSRFTADDPNRRDAALIHDTTVRATRLVRQLLAFSRKELAHPQVLDVDETIGGLAAMLRRLIREDIDLRITLRSGGARSRIDRGHLEQVVVNLVVNARDAMPDAGAITIDTSRAPVAPGAPDRLREWLVLEVRDTGSGMTNDTRARLFEPFFTTKGAHGTGIGLATIQGIVRDCGGQIVVDSEPGRGSTFRVYLPATDEAAAPPPPAATDAVPAPATETILLVEDDTDLRDLARELLDECGYTVLVAVTGADAVRLAAEHPAPIQLLLTDVVMPGLQGPDVFARVRVLQPGIRALFMSGYTDEALTAQFEGDPSVVLLEKPFDRQSLAVRVRQVLDV
jgi:PAS domain S-box-containing protein